MATAKVFERVGQFVGSDTYCVEGLHVHTTVFYGSTTSRTVTTCDDSCKEKPAIEEQDCPENVVRALREKVGKRTQRLSPSLGRLI